MPHAGGLAFRVNHTPQLLTTPRAVFTPAIHACLPQTQRGLAPCSSPPDVLAVDSPRLSLTFAKRWQSRPSRRCAPAMKRTKAVGWTRGQR
eukprot:scaffold36208_cov78-Phaeocystis_antarctica.AAC.4